MDLIILAEKLNTDQKLTASERSWVLENDPGNVLVVYGSLAPGKSNHHHVASIAGEWKEAIIHGVLVEKGWGQNLGYPGLRFQPEDSIEPIDCLCLFSSELAKHFDHLDVFEGVDYRRIVIPFQLNDGNSGIGNVYALNVT